MKSHDIDAMTKYLREFILVESKRSGAVVGVSGGVDSAVTLALTARAVGPENTLGVLLPERESSSTSLSAGKKVCETFSVPYVVDDITDALQGLGCYDARDSAVRELIPDYSPPADVLSMRLRQDLRGSRMPASYEVVVERPDGTVVTRRPSGSVYRKIFAASNYKQRVRTSKLYYHAEVTNACVVGTSNLDEEYLGFFVKIGDGTWDVCVLDGLVKTQVMALAAALGVPEEVLGRPTTTDTFPAEEQSQEEMFYSLPFHELDALLGAIIEEKELAGTAAELGWNADETATAVSNLLRRHRSTAWNRATPGRFSAQPSGDAI